MIDIHWKDRGRKGEGGLYFLSLFLWERNERVCKCYLVCLSLTGKESTNQVIRWDHPYDYIHVTIKIAPTMI